MSDFYMVFIIAGSLGLQYFLSTRENVYWGVVIPVVYTGAFIWMYIAGVIESLIAVILYVLLGLFFLVLEWKRGRKSLINRRNKELEKMKTYDMN
ncbi:hypothetical protein [Halobacillus sp. A5]|uniref:hypothetical protein n=1 Tax=Halobacillus sp. A5 TaxID=2880263 RepID=UPI0020A68C3A|nr:hypothetical protein [Halobacillus sp. A5]MCP3029502.1 hypothetical protein [Halobacillus sp. A5]